MPDGSEASVKPVACLVSTASGRQAAHTGEIVADFGDGDKAAEERNQVCQRSSCQGATRHLERKTHQLWCDSESGTLTGIRRAHAEHQPLICLFVREPFTSPGTGFRFDGLNSMVGDVSIISSMLCNDTFKCRQVFQRDSGLLRHAGAWWSAHGPGRLRCRRDGTSWMPLRTGRLLADGLSAQLFTHGGLFSVHSVEIQSDHD